MDNYLLFISFIGRIIKSYLLNFEMESNMSKKRNKILTKLLEETQQEIPHFLNIYSQQVLNGDASLF